MPAKLSLKPSDNLFLSALNKLSIALKLSEEYFFKSTKPDVSYKNPWCTSVGK